MNVLGRLALLFVIVPIVELVLLIQIGQVVGLLPTIALVVFTGVTGAWLARAEGVRVFFQFQSELASGRLPGQALLDGISVLIGGAFLLTPGVLTDVVGFSLLLPFTRRWIQRRVRGRLEKRIADGSIHVVTMGSGGTWGFSGGGPFGRPPTQGGAEKPLDPSKGIVVEPDEDTPAGR
ncbi:MAG: FxsA family protein [Gemmatimonadota bacterium]|nr:FxsA family protein [Gemmatimonadota bacterium]